MRLGNQLKAEFSAMKLPHNTGLCRDIIFNTHFSYVKTQVFESYFSLLLYSETTSSSILCFSAILIISLEVHSPMRAFLRESSPRDHSKCIISGRLFITAHTNNSWKLPSLSCLTPLPLQSSYNDFSNSKSD